MMDINQVIFTGHICCKITDNMLRKTRGGREVINIRIAVQKDNNPEEADYINCSAFGINARNIVKYSFEGQDVSIEGRICSENYIISSEEKHRMYVLINKIIFHGYKEDD